MAIAQPELKMCLTGRHVLEINPSGKFMSLNRARMTYPRFSVTDIMAETWECWSEWQMRRMAAGGDPGPIGRLAGEMFGEDENAQAFNGVR